MTVKYGSDKLGRKVERCLQMWEGDSGRTFLLKQTLTLRVPYISILNIFTCQFTKRLSFSLELCLSFLQFGLDIV